jgi:hypothetical protein
MLAKCIGCGKPVTSVRTEYVPVQGRSPGHGRLLLVMCPLCHTVFSTMWTAIAALATSRNLTIRSTPPTRK